MSDYQQYFVKAKTAKKALINLGEETINSILLAIATQAVQQTAYLLQENAKDLAKMSADDPKYDRLLLNKERIAAIAADIRNVALLKTPLGTVLSSQVMPNEMQIKKVRVPLGVVGVIYEARPNVTFDVFSLAFKTGNVIILKGGSDAEHSNAAIVGLIQAVLDAHQLDPAIVTLLPTERESTDALLQATGFVDVLIPRGSQGLINFVRENSKVPVIETGAGIVHIYGDESAAIDRLQNIVFNAKTRRPSVCNSLDCLIVHQALLMSLPEVVKPLASKEVVIFADHKAYEALLTHYPDNLLHLAEDMHYGTEFLSLKMSIKTVNSMAEALSHIEQYSSKHSEAIVSEDEEQIAYFLNHVDAAAVYANVSTAFTDGAQFGLGAEIGISTQKLHARGPMGLEELTSYKWIVEGTGQIRN